MNSERLEIGQAAPELDQRNPSGWILLLGLAAFLIVSQLVVYFTRKPSSDVQFTRSEQQLKFQLSTSQLPGGQKNVSVLHSLAQDLEPKLSDPKMAALYAAVRTEAGESVDRKKIVSLRAKNKPANRAIFEIYSESSLNEEQAKKLASAIPQDSFLHRLIRVQALEKAKVADSGRSSLNGNRSWLQMAAVGIIIIGGFLFGIAILIAYFIARSQKQLTPKGFPTGDISLSDADRLVKRSAQIFTSFVGISLIGAILLRPFRDSPLASLSINLAILGMVIFLASIPVDGKWITLKSIGITRENLGKNVVWGVAAALANIPILLVVTAVSTFLMRGLPAPEHPTTVELTTTTDPLVIVSSLIMAAVLAPIIEEIMFRGTMFPGFSRAFRSPLWGGLASSFIFAAIHPTGIPIWPSLAAIGGMSCVLVYHTRSLVPSMVMHAVHNLGTLVLVLLATR